MRLTLVLLVAACWTSSRDAPVAPVANAAAPTATCEQATRALVLELHAEPNDYVAARCKIDHWPDATRACFARMRALDLRCTDGLDDDSREQLLRAIEDPSDPRVTVAIGLTRLMHLRTGIPECDALVGTIAYAFTCDAIPLEDRVLLAGLPSDFRDATNPRLRASFAALCTKSIADVQKQTRAAGCGP